MKATLALTFPPRRGALYYEYLIVTLEAQQPLPSSLP